MAEARELARRLSNLMQMRQGSEEAVHLGGSPLLPRSPQCRLHQRSASSSHFKEGVIKVFCGMVCLLQNLRTNMAAGCKEQARTHLPCTKAFKALLI